MESDAIGVVLSGQEESTPAAEPLDDVLRERAMCKPSTQCGRWRCPQGNCQTLANNVHSKSDWTY